MKIKTKYLLIFFSLIAFVGCKKKGCTNSLAINYNSEAKKDDGTCVYPEPVPDDREPYLGNYLVTDSLFMFGTYDTQTTYTLNVSTGGTVSDTIYLNNLWDDGINYFAILSGLNFSIPSQQVSGPYYASGSGNFTNDVITYQTSGDIYINKGNGPKQ